MPAPRWLLGLLLLPLVLAACAVRQTEGAAGPGAEWRYGGEQGPERWAALDPAYAACAAGREQSPVNLEGAQHAPAPVLVPAYRPAELTIIDNGHTIEAESHGASGGIVLGGTRYELLQFHFHAPGEHAVAGRDFPMELHLVHRSAEGNLAVIGILIREGRENPALAPLFEALPEQGGESHVDLSPGRILPADRASYRYSGSLTTPPCSEGVRWTVLKEPIELSRDQILAFTHRYFGTNRPVQPLNGRMIAAG